MKSKNDYKIKILNFLKGYNVEWIDSEIYILSKGNRLYVSKDLKLPFKQIGKFPLNFIISMLSKSRVFQRFLRSMYYNVIRLDSGEIFVTFQKKVGLFRNGKFFSVKGLDKDARFLRGSCAVDEKGGIYFGEYNSNPKRGVVNIYYLPQNSTSAEVVFQFPENSIRHVHGIYFDKYDNSIWCVCGDLEKECRILKTKNCFKNFEVVGEGDETWRTVSLIFTKDSIYYGMDAEFRQNYIYQINRKDKKRTELIKVDGPIYYSHKVGEKIFFEVTAENCPSSNNLASLWSIDSNKKIEKIISYPKDILHQYFMPGTIHFPLGPGRKNELFFSCVGLKNMDNKVVKITD